MGVYCRNVAVAERELARQDLLALVEFVGTKGFCAFLDNFLSCMGKSPKWRL
jgi:hypothetical protein